MVSVLFSIIQKNILTFDSVSRLLAKVENVEHTVNIRLNSMLK